MEDVTHASFAEEGEYNKPVQAVCLAPVFIIKENRKHYSV